MKTQFKMFVVGFSALTSLILNSGCASAPGAEVTDEQINAEAEADQVGLWERMEAADGGKGPEFLSTHPSGQTRIGELNRLMSDAQSIYQNAPQKYGLGSGI